jgi:8-hydroxy-5-deazaflavin:NADPH oxidoreductase
MKERLHGADIRRDRTMKLGFIGAGSVAGAIARYAIAAGHEVILTSHNPEKVAALVSKLGKGASVGSLTEVADGDLVFLAVPWSNVSDALAGVPNWSGKILVDTTNPFAQTSPKLALADLGDKSASEIVAGHATGARLVKAFNSITMHNFEQGPKRGDAYRALLVSGDDASAKKLVVSLIQSFGFKTIDMGDLITGGRLSQAGAPLATGADLLIAD